MRVSSGTVQLSAISNLGHEVGTQTSIVKIAKTTDHGACRQTRCDADWTADEADQPAGDRAECQTECTFIANLLDGNLAIHLLCNDRGCIERQASFGMKLLECPQPMIGLRLFRKNDNDELAD
jgi:hypothetical protein